MSVRTRVVAAAATLLIATPAFAQQIAPSVQKRIDRILKRTPLIDGHNDLPEQLRDNYKLSVDGLASGGAEREKPLMTDMARLRQGRVGGQFWSVWIPGTYHRRRSDPDDDRADRYRYPAREGLSDRSRAGVHRTTTWSGLTGAAGSAR